MEGDQELGAIITDGQRIAHLEQKVDFLEQSVTDLRRAVERLNALVGERRLEEIRMSVQSGGVTSEPESGDIGGTRFVVSASSL